MNKKLIIAIATLAIALLISGCTVARQKNYDPINTSNWKTYTNEQQRYTFKYPQNWDNTTDEEGSWQRFYSKDFSAISEYLGGDFPQETINNGGRLMVSVEKIEGDHWEEYSFEELKDTYGGSRKVFDTKQVIVGGDIAIYRDYVQHKTRNAGSDLILHHTNQNGDILYTKLIIISAIDEKEGYQRIFDQIISTFRFLE